MKNKRKIFHGLTLTMKLVIPWLPKKSIQKLTIKVNLYGYQTGNCIPCQNKSSGSKHIETVKKILIKNALILDLIVFWRLKKYKIKANNARLPIKILGNPDGIWSKLNEPIVNFDNILSGLYSNLAWIELSVYWPLLLVRVIAVGIKITAAMPPARIDRLANNQIQGISI